MNAKDHETIRSENSSARAFVVMGVSGCGKSSIGAAVARALGGTFIDGDALHPANNIAKMARGEPLNDADRAPWLIEVGKTLAQHDETTLIACSALKRQYRDAIAQAAGKHVTYLFLDGSPEVIAKRLAKREGHFMPATLLASQFETLQPPTPPEDAITVNIDQPFDAVVQDLLAGIHETS